MGDKVRVAPEPVEELARCLDETGLRLSELACRSQAAGAALGCVPAAARLSDVAGWCDQMADDLRLLVERAHEVDEQAVTAVVTAGLGGPWEEPELGRNHLGEVAGGAWDSLSGTVAAVNDLTLQLLWDPVGWWRDWGEVGEGMIFAVDNPGEAARAAVDMDTLESNPARWAGQLVPDLLGGALTGGTIVGARRSTDAVDTLAHLSRTAPRLADGEGVPRHLPPVTIGWATSTGPRLDRYIATLPRGRSRKPHIRVVPSLEHMEEMIERIRSRAATSVPHPAHAEGELLFYADGTRVDVRISDPHGLTLDVRTVDQRYWKVHIHGS